MKKVETLKECVVTLKNGLTYTQHFHFSWNNKTITSYMLSMCSIEKTSISEIRISSISIYQ